MVAYLIYNIIWERTIKEIHVSGIKLYACQLYAKNGLQVMTTLYDALSPDTRQNSEINIDTYTSENINVIW